MTQQANWKNTFLALAMASVALPALAQDPAAPASDDSSAAQSEALAQSDAVLSGALTALEETANAIKALEADKPDEARAALELAIGKLEATLAANPDLALAPVNVTSSVLDIQATPSEIRALRKEALRLMKDHQLQLARRLVTGLASEVDVSTTYLPLGTYPLALKSAVALIASDDTDAAIAVLGNALDTLVVVETALPLPLLNAGLLIDEAKGLSEKADRSDEENTRLTALLDAIEVQIAKGEALEYGGAGAFDDIRAELKTVRAATSDGGSGTGLLDKLKGLFGKLGQDHAAAAQ